MLEALLGWVPEAQEAVLSGYRRYLVVDEEYPGIRVVDEEYPGIRPSSVENSEVSGLLIVGLTNYEVSIMDSYEGDAYQRLPVEVGRGLVMWINQ